MKRAVNIKHKTRIQILKINMAAKNIFYLVYIFMISTDLVRVTKNLVYFSQRKKKNIKKKCLTSGWTWVTDQISEIFARLFLCDAKMADRFLLVAFRVLHSVETHF